MKKQNDDSPIQWDIVAVWVGGILFSLSFWAGLIYLIWS